MLKRVCCSFFTDARVEVRNLIDDQMISFGRRYLTTIDAFDAKSIFDIDNLDTLSLFRQRQLRQTIVSLVKSIEQPKLRVTFCRKHLPVILSNAFGTSWEQIKRNARDYMKNDVSHDFQGILSKLHSQLKNENAILPTDESQLIAETIQQEKRGIPLISPIFQEVCSYCFLPNDLIACKGKCAGLYHQKCINARSAREIPEKEWKKMEEGFISEAPRDRRNGRTSRLDGVCLDCRTSQSNQSASNNHSNCATCRTSIGSDERVTSCIKCPDSFHSTSSCIPPGALLLSETQLICRNHESHEVKKIAVCSKCCKKSSNNRLLYDCIKCPERFHRRCNSSQLECPECRTAHRSDDVVLTFSSELWWPAIIVSQNQVPNDVFKKRRLFGPGAVFVFIIGKNEYQQDYSTNLLSFRISDGFRDKVCRPNGDIEYENAVEIADKLIPRSE